MNKLKPKHLYNNGWEYFTPDPGEEEFMYCRACGEKMDVIRNTSGPRGFAQAMGGSESLHDAFFCPNAGRGWHEQLIQLLIWMQDIPSQVMLELLQKEVDQILQTREPTLSSFRKDIPSD